VSRHDYNSGFFKKKRKGLVAILLKGRKSRPRAKPRVGKTKRSAAHASWIAAEILFAAGKKIGAESRRHAPSKGNAPVFQDKRFLLRRAVRPRNTARAFALSFPGPVFLR
jgi:hypothetical protein